MPLLNWKTGMIVDKIKVQVLHIVSLAPKPLSVKSLVRSMYDSEEIGFPHPLVKETIFKMLNAGELGRTSYHKVILPLNQGTRHDPD